MTWMIARAYARAYGILKDTTGINLRGLGRVLHSVKREHEFQLSGQRMVFEPSIAGCYDRLIAGDFNEPETFNFLLRAVQSLAHPVTFIEVGANVGEFLIPLAGHPTVQRAIGFEAHPVCSAVCQRNARLNDLEHVEIRTALVGDGLPQRFHINEVNPNASGIDAVGELRSTVRLDDELTDVHAPAIMLIDVEGAEPLVLQGALRFIKRTRPLIIFEYNDVSKRHFAIAGIAELLGEPYRIYRLRRDGKLDGELEKSWNCVAIPVATEFERLITAESAVPRAR